MLSPELLSSVMEWARYLIVRLFITLSLISLFPTILVLLLEPLIIALRSINTPSPSSSAATTPSSSRATSRNSSRAPSVRNLITTPASSPKLSDLKSSNKSAVVDEKSVSVPVSVIPTVAVSVFDGQIRGRSGDLGMGGLNEKAMTSGAAVGVC